jgi:cobyrinic acid a,c-diamide synthase
LSEPPSLADKKPAGLPGVVVAALRGGSGKTIFSVGIIAALRSLGYCVAPFKKGPDYIDAGWLGLAAGRPCYNLDSFLVAQERISASFQFHTAQADLALIEGNRGLYDCIDLEGRTSTAELAKLLNLPLLLCIDGTKTTRTMAAVVAGCQQFDPRLNLAGVLINRIAGSRHEKILRDSIEHYCGIPVLGAVPKLGRQAFPERHMGLVPTAEHDWAQMAIEQIASIACQYLDLAAVVRLCGARKNTPPGEDHIPTTVSQPLAFLQETSASQKDLPTGTAPPVRIGIIRDSAFQFYYPENFEALQAAGASLVFTSPLTDEALPDVDGLYIGGGFPETHARQLSENRSYRQQIKALADADLPIYAECGGLMYLGRELVLEAGRYSMAGVLPLVFGFSKRPQGHGYTIIEVDKENPYFERSSELKGHEFHYSNILKWDGSADDLVFRMKRGNGIIDGFDGVRYRNVLATYTHIHAHGTPGWAHALVARAALFRRQKTP